MQTVDQIRRQRLAELVKQSGGVAALASRIEKSAAQLSQWLNASPDSKTGRPRGMRSESCRQIERKCGYPPGWMDRLDGPQQEQSEPAGFRQVFGSTVELSTASAALVRQIIKAEEFGTATPQIIDVLTRVLDLVLPTTRIEDADRVTRLIDDQ
jgi:hypothetical protein